jgi:hypothetical protein
VKKLFSLMKLILGFIINQRDVTFLTSLFILYMFRTVLVHHQEFYFVMYAGLTGMCGLCGVHCLRAV